MTYIKWKDEVESYLGNLSESEKQKVFSYFAEMYADKRDAGISEESIIEGFGAPYDVAQRIIADSKDSSSAQSENAGGNASGAVSGSGGNNYNYNYYNYNYGGAPTGFNNGAPSGFDTGANADGRASYYGRDYEKKPADVDVSDIDMPLPEGTPKLKEKNKKGNPVVSVILLILLAIPVFVLLCTCFGLIVGFFSAAMGCIISGCATIGEAIGGLVGGLGKSQIGLMGSGFIQFGVGALFIPLTILVAKLVWKLIRWVFRQLKTVASA